jgi:hypothetical protein
MLLFFLRHLRLPLLAAVALSAWLTGAAAAAVTCPLPDKLPPFTTQPNAAAAYKQHSRLLQVESRTGLGPYGALAFGDSIVARWSTASLSTALGAATLDAGVGGYGTGELLWLLDNVPLGPQSPGRILLLIGTDNLNAPACNIYWGIRVTVAELQDMFPATSIIVTSVLPRGAMLLDHSADIDTINLALSEDTTDYQFFDVHNKLGAACDWTTPCKLYGSDNLHPSLAGFQFLTARLQAFLGTTPP